MNLMRMFSYTNYKGEKLYLKHQRNYEIVRTCMYFFLSFSLLAGGYFATHTRANLLTIVAVLGCLPACKSLVSTIMFCRYTSLPVEVADQLAAESGELPQVFDMVFTSEKKTFQIDHLVVKGNLVCGYSRAKDFPEKDFEKHILGILRMDNIKDVTVKIFTDFAKYSRRLKELASITGEGTGNQQNPILDTLKSVSL